MLQKYNNSYKGDNSPIFMIELKRRTGNGQIAYIFRAVPELNFGDVSGFVEQWYVGGSESQGIKVEDKDKLMYSELVGRGQGVPLGNIGFYGMVAQDKFYDETSFLINGTIITSSKRREYFGRKESDLPKIKVAENMPEQILTILAETQDKVLATARMLKLPLEERLLIRSK